MYNRVLIRQEDLSDMLRTTDSRDLSDFLHLNTNFSSARKTAQVSAQGTSRNSKKYEEEMECLLLSLLIIKNSTHRLILEMGKGFLYEYRNIYLACDGIVISDKKVDSNCIRFTLAPYIPLAIGAISCLGESSLPGADRRPDNHSSEHHRTVSKIRVKEISPEGEISYESRCEPGAEPEEIERMVKFVIFSHSACLKGVAENGGIFG